MKTIRYLFCFILIFSNIEVLRGDYSIDTFLDYLQQSGYYELIQSIKIYFGDDVAIDVCLELTQTNDCETVVKVYMTGGNKITFPRPPIDPKIFKEIFQYFENNYNISNEMRELIELIISFYDNLIENMNIEEIINFIERIIKNKKIEKTLQQNKEIKT